MRWHTARFETSAEASQRKGKLDAIDAWWTGFQQASPTIDALFSARDARPDFDLVEWMRDHLGAVDPRLMWEFGPALAGKRHRLVITPERERRLRPLTDALLARAPVADFEFYGARIAETLAEGVELAKGRTQSEILVTGIDFARGAGNRVDVTVTAAPGAGERELDIAWSQALMVCTTWLGEETTDRWLGYVDVAASTIPGSPLDGVKDRFGAALDACRRARQSQPYHLVAAGSEWSLLKMDPDPEREITRRSDLFVHRTMDLEFFQTTRRRIPFYSDRFSSHGERFCYLMLDGRNAEMEGFEDKAEIEDALEAALVPTQLGTVVGSGTGTRYSYIDLAVTDVERACDAMIDVLRRGGIVRNAWILFHDDEWQDEWIGIYAETPPPIPLDPDD